MSLLKALKSYRRNRSHNPYYQEQHITAYILFNNWEILEGAVWMGGGVHAYADFISSNNF